MSNIIILGAGQVGTSVAKSLATEQHNITVIDRDTAKLKDLASKYDLRTVAGNAGHPSVLKEAGIADCDLLIAVTEVDEINMMACKIASSSGVTISLVVSSNMQQSSLTSVLTFSQAVVSSISSSNSPSSGSVSITVFGAMFGSVGFSAATRLVDSVSTKSASSFQYLG